MRLKEHLPTFRQIRHFLNRVPAVVQFFAGLATVTSLIIVAVILLTGDGSVDDPDVSRAPTVRPRPNPPTDPVLPDLLVSKVNSCELVPPASEDPEDVIFLLSLTFKIINRGILNFEPSSVFIGAVSDHELEGLKATYLGEDSWDYDFVLLEWASDDYIVIPIKLTDFGKDHRIVISVDSPGIGSDSQVQEDDESNNDTVVLVRLPQEPPADEYYTVPCSAPDATP